EKGLVRFTDISEGSYDIEIFYKEEWEFEDFNLGTPITITTGQSRNEGTWLLESRGIIGSVHSKSGEEALTNATVSAILNNSIILSVFTDNKGDFQLRGIPTGNYSLFVVAEGYIPSQWNEIELVPELNTTGIELELEKASTDILLVIESPEGQHLELPLGLMDYPVTIWPSYEVGSPRAQDMSQFDAVIWYAGITATMNSHLNGLVNETEELQDYLENQGNLLLIGQDVIYDLGANHPFIQEILGVQSVRQDIGVTDTLTGVPNDAIGSNIRLNCHQGMFLDYADKVTPAAGASGILEGINDNFYYGIRKDGSSRVIFFPFDTNLILSVEETAILINQCLSWFGTAQQGYETEYQPKKESTAPEWPGLALLGTLIVITLLLGAVLFGKRRQGKNLKETTE
ncbi:MAG: carboxypeptidase-like regulatory domain-containing protein, partial [Candidatus Hodarchaeota archaeon]